MIQHKNNHGEKFQFSVFPEFLIPCISKSIYFRFHSDLRLHFSRIEPKFLCPLIIFNAFWLRVGRLVGGSGISYGCSSAIASVLLVKDVGRGLTGSRFVSLLIKRLSALWTLSTASVARLFSDMLLQREAGVRKHPEIKSGLALGKPEVLHKDAIYIATHLESSKDVAPQLDTRIPRPGIVGVFLVPCFHPWMSWIVLYRLPTLLT